MAWRWGSAPVFVSEWRTGARQWTVFAARSALVAALLASAALVWWSRVAGRPIATIRELASVGEAFFAMVETQLLLVPLAVPAATAGAICQGRAGGTLDQLLATDLSAAEIVLGKLAARLAAVMGVVACTVPVMALGDLLGGIDPEAMAGAFVISSGVAVLGSALALTLSVWATRAHEVLMAVYAAWAYWLLPCMTWDFLAWYWSLGPPPPWVRRSSPFWLAFAPYMASQESNARDAAGLLSWNL